MLPRSNALRVIAVFIMLLACSVLYGMGAGNEKPVKHEDIHQGSFRALVKRATNHSVALAAYKDFYPYGQLMPGRNYQTTDYPYGYQGQYTEIDPETGFTHFEAREFDSRLGRWMVPDPAGQHWSPYLGMGNNPVSGVDPDGARWFTNGADCKWFSGFKDFWHANFGSTWNLTPHDGTTTDWTGNWVKTSEPFVVHAPTWSSSEINPENGLMWVKGINSVPIEFFIIAPASLPFKTGFAAIDFSLIALNPIGGLRGGAAKGVVQAEKVSGSYLLEFQSGKFYAGKGLEPRMMQSINRIETTYGDNLLNSTFYPASSTRAAFINEHNLMMQFGGPKSFNPLSPTYNKIFSPGRKLGGF